MNFDIETVVEQMMKAAAGPLGKYWKTIGPVARDEFTKIAHSVEQTGIDRSTQKITEQDAIDRLANAKDAAQCALDDQLGEGLVATEEAITAALNAVSSIVNGYLGLKVI